MRLLRVDGEADDVGISAVCADATVVATARPDEAPSASQWEAACGMVLLTGAAPPLEFSAPSSPAMSPQVKESHPPVDAAATTATFSQF